MGRKGRGRRSLFMQQGAWRMKKIGIIIPEGQGTFRQDAEQASARLNVMPVFCAGHFAGVLPTVRAMLSAHPDIQALVARSTTASTEVVGSGSSIVLPQPTAPADPAAQSGSSSTGETGAVTGTADNWQTSLGSNLRKLDLKVNNGDLALVLDPAATEFTLQVNGLDQSILRTRADDGGLNVQLGPQGNQQGHLFTATLIIPDTGVLQDLDVSLSSADLDLPDMTLDELEISLNAGDVQAGEISARSISLETNAGNIYAAACQADEVSLETNAGRIEAARVQPGRELEVSSNAGEITASLTGTASDYTLQAEVLAGSLTYDGTSYSSLAQQLRQGAGAVEIDVECAAGQIDLSFPG